MAEIRLKFNNYGFYRLRSAPGVVADLERRIARIKAAGSPTWDTHSFQGQMRPQGRWQTNVVAFTYDDLKENSQNNTLLKALDAGR